MFLPVVNCAMRVAVDEITMLSFVYGPAALMKRTPGKKTSQGFQLIAMCSKYVIMGIGLSFLHQFRWDLSQSGEPLIDPVMSPTMHRVLELYIDVIPPGAMYYSLYQDNRFNQARLTLNLWYLLRLFVIRTY
jgi:hypothetical protein